MKIDLSSTWTLDIYSSSVDEMVAVVDLLDAAMKTRENLLDQDLSGSIA